jgi:hypothetical protein
LGVWLDRKLNYKAHAQAVKKKMATQTFALTRLAAKTWGCSFERAREIYTKVIRSTIAYGASAYHQPTELYGKPRGIATGLAKHQTKCLRVVAGAYKATPVRSLETETYCPPIDLYLNKRVRAFEERVARTDQAKFVRGTAAWVASCIQVGSRRRAPPPKDLPESGAAKARWAEDWAPTADLIGENAPEDAQQQNGPSAKDRERRLEEAMRREWVARWEIQMAAAMSKSGRRYRLTIAELHPKFDGTSIRRHMVGRRRRRRRGEGEGEGEDPRPLSKAKSSLLVQARTEVIGLRSFLFQRKVPDVETPYCSCGTGRETFAHLVYECLWTVDQWARAGEWPQDLEQLASYLDNGEQANRLLSWALRLGRLREYRLAVELEGEEVGGAGLWE